MPMQRFVVMKNDYPLAVLALGTDQEEAEAYCRKLKTAAPVSPTGHEVHFWAKEVPVVLKTEMES
jgi:hypothetical protein